MGVTEDGDRQTQQGAEEHREEGELQRDPDALQKGGILRDKDLPDFSEVDHGVSFVDSI